MKQLLLSFMILFIGLASQAQNPQYIEVMKKNIEKINYINTVEEIQDAANQFERVANVEKEEWLPSYYATIAYVILASKDMEKGGAKIQDYVDKAKENLANAQKIAPDNSEVLTAQGYVSLAHIWINPMANGAQYSMQAYGEFEEAMNADPTNPRPHYLKGTNVFFTPDAFGGGKENAKPLFLAAKEKFEKFEPTSEIAPNWGKESNDYFLGMYQEKKEEDQKEEQTQEVKQEKGEKQKVKEQKEGMKQEIEEKQKEE